MADSDWATEVREILTAVDRAHQALDDLSRWLWDHVVGHDVLPRELPQPAGSHLDTLRHEILEIRQLAHQAFYRYSSRLSEKTFTGAPLTREEYYLCRAMGVDFGTGREIGLVRLDDYDVYRMCCYEDDTWSGYINALLEPRDPASRRIAARLREISRRVPASFPPTRARRLFSRTSTGVYERFADD